MPTTTVLIIHALGKSMPLTKAIQTDFQWDSLYILSSQIKTHRMCHHLNTVSKHSKIYNERMEENFCPYNIQTNYNSHCDCTVIDDSHTTLKSDWYSLPYSATTHDVTPMYALVMILVMLYFHAMKKIPHAHTLLYPVFTPSSRSPTSVVRH